MHEEPVIPNSPEDERLQRVWDIEDKYRIQAGQRVEYQSKGWEIEAVNEDETITMFTRTEEWEEFIRDIPGNEEVLAKVMEQRGAEMSGTPKKIESGVINKGGYYKGPIISVRLAIPGQKIKVKISDVILDENREFNP